MWSHHNYLVNIALTVNSKHKQTKNCEKIDTKCFENNIFTDPTLVYSRISDLIICKMLNV